MKLDSKISEIKKMDLSMLKLEKEMQTLENVMKAARLDLLNEQALFKEDFVKMEKHFMLAEENLET